MEQVMERTATPKYDWRTFRIFDEDGSQIKNPKVLRSIAEAMELGDAWERRMESYHLEEIFGPYDEEDEDVDTEEEDS